MIIIEDDLALPPDADAIGGSAQLQPELVPTLPVLEELRDQLELGQVIFAIDTGIIPVRVAVLIVVIHIGDAIDIADLPRRGRLFDDCLAVILVRAAL